MIPLLSFRHTDQYTPYIARVLILIPVWFNDIFASFRHTNQYTPYIARVLILIPVMICGAEAFSRRIYRSFSSM